MQHTTPALMPQKPRSEQQALAGLLEAQLDLGNFYWGQIGIAYQHQDGTPWSRDEQIEQCARWYRMAIEQHQEPKAIYALSRLMVDENRYDEFEALAATYQTEDADLSNKTYNRFCYLARYERYKESDPVRVISYLEGAAKLGDRDALVDLFDWYDYGAEHHDPVQMVYYAKKLLAKKMIYNGCRESLGMAYYYGIGVKQDYVAAMKAWLSSDQKWSPPRRYCLEIYHCLINGLGVAVDKRKAIYYLYVGTISGWQPVGSSAAQSEGAQEWVQTPEGVQCTELLRSYGLPAPLPPDFNYADIDHYLDTQYPS